MKNDAEAPVLGRKLERAYRMSSPSTRATEAELNQLLDLLEKNADSLGVDASAMQQLRGVVEQGLAVTEQRSEADRSASERLLAHVSHELRTPLTPALLAICLLQRDRTLPPDVQTELTVIRRSIEQEARLIDNLIDQAAFVEAAADAHLRIA